MSHKLEQIQEVKRVITNAPVLGYYNPSEPLTLEVDASKHGLGACLMQKGKPIAFASKSLTEAEVRYAQIEKELLAILFGCKRFHQYTYGNEVIVHSDHKPISSIMLKPLHAAPPRLQRMLLQLQKYNISVRHVSGKDIPVSDCLSRHSLDETYPSLIDGLDCHVHTVTKQLFVTDSRIQNMKDELANDSEMQILKKTIVEGWPSNRSDCRPEIVSYWNHRDELSWENNLCFRGQTLVVPRALRKHMIEQVHSSHLGVTKTLERAKDNLFWPGMSKEITDYVLQCPICLEHRDSNAKEPMITTEFPDRPYQKVGVDLFHFDGGNYLLTIDYYSRFFEVDYLPNTRSSTVIRKLQVHMSRNGIVDCLVSDNAPQFSSDEFAKFAKTWDFEHHTSSPFYPKGNSLSEKGVGIAKKLMKKAKASGQNPHLAFLEYRNTPLECGFTPAQLLFGRRTKSVVPISTKALNQKVSHRKVATKMNELKTKQKAIYDRNSKPLKPLAVNDSCRVQFGKKWVQAKVIGTHGPRSFSVQTQNGAIYRRNRTALIKTNENVTDIPDTFCPNIFAKKDANTPSHPEPPPSQNPIRQLPVSNAPYTTRSGRVVKQKCYDSREWTK